MSGSVDDYHFQWCPRDDPDFRRLNNPVCICDALSDAMREATREVLADLRAKVEGLPCRTWVPPHATDCPGRPGKRGICTCGDSLRASDWMLRADVLALIEEADRG